MTVPSATAVPLLARADDSLYPLSCWLCARNPRVFFSSNHPCRASTVTSVERASESGRHPIWAAVPVQRRDGRRRRGPGIVFVVGIARRSLLFRRRLRLLLRFAHPGEFTGAEPHLRADRLSFPALFAIPVRLELNKWRPRRSSIVIPSGSSIRTTTIVTRSSITMSLPMCPDTAPG